MQISKPKKFYPKIQTAICEKLGRFPRAGAIINVTDVPPMRLPLTTDWCCRQYDSPANPLVRETQMRTTFEDHVKQNSSLRGKHVSRREHQVGRPRPTYCELHTRLLLPEKEKRHWPVADHNHENGKYRGWLCSTCNTQIIPEIDRLKQAGIDADDVLAFFRIAIQYVFTDGANLKDIYRRSV